MTLRKITDFYRVVLRLSHHNLKILNHRQIKNVVKENYYLNKACRYVHDLLINQTSLVKVQRFMNCLHKTKCEF
jgi:hypothetical protein